MPTRTQQADLLGAAYASHGDTKHPMLLPADPGECFEMGALAFDLADRLQTTIFVMLDLDIGMNEWLTEPFTWDDSRKLDRGKVMTYEELEAGARLRPLPRRRRRRHPLPHLSRRRTRPRAPISPAAPRATPTPATREEGAVYVDNMERLLRKFETAKSLIPAPIRRDAKRKTPRRRDLFRLHDAGDARGAGGAGGAGAPPRRPAGARLPVLRRGLSTSSPRTSGCSWSSRTATRQLRTLLVNEGEIDPAKLVAGAAL